MCIAPNSCVSMGLKLSNGKKLFSSSAWPSLTSTESGLKEAIPFLLVRLGNLSKENNPTNKQLDYFSHLKTDINLLVENSYITYYTADEALSETGQTHTIPPVIAISCKDE